MPYTKVNWEDYPSTATPLNATNLDKMDSGIKNLDDVYESLKKPANNGKLVYVHEGALDTLEPSNLDLHVGSPTVVSSLDEMTDTSKIYVYDGDWYAYNGSEWVDKGQFNEPEIVTDKTLNVSDRPADGKAVGDALSTKAEIDGEYESMTVGSAEQLVSDISENDSTAYNFRTAGGSIDIGDRVDETVIGGSLVWNQLIWNGDFSDNEHPWIKGGASDDYTIGVADGVLTVEVLEIEGTTAAVIKSPTPYVPVIDGHVYLYSMDYRVNGHALSNDVRIGYNTDSIASKLADTMQPTDPVDTWIESRNIFKPTEVTRFGLRIGATNAAGLSSSDSYSIRNACIFDLTQMFGSTIAEYLRTLEQTTAGAGVAWFKRLFPKPYYAYNAGTLMSVKAGSHITRGFNAWDEEWEVGKYNGDTGEKQSASNQIRSKNKISILPNTSYYFWFPSGTTMNGVLFYGADESYLGTDYAFGVATPGVKTTPSNAYYMTFQMNSAYGTTYNNDICINLSWDASRDGEYEEYEEHTYTLDNTLELRGIPKLDSSNNLTFDGDKYESDGTVTRRYGIVDLGTLSWITTDEHIFRAPLSLRVLNKPTQGAVCSKYVFYGVSTYAGYAEASPDKTFSLQSNANNWLNIVDTDYSSETDFKTAMSGVYLVYELAIPTEESASTYAKNQIVNDFGTEEYTDYAYEAGDRDVAIPVGHFSKYQPNLKAKLEMAPDSPSSDGDYVVRHANGMNSYVPLTIQVPTELPADPTTNGQYYLKLTVQDGQSTLTWASEYSPTV